MSVKDNLFVKKQNINGRISSNFTTKHYYKNRTPDAAPYNCSCCSIINYRGKLHLLGSLNSTAARYHYIWDGASWVSVSTLPYTFSNGAAIVINDEIHIFGGAASTTIDRYHYKWNGSTWTKVSTLAYHFRDGIVTCKYNPIDNQYYIYLFGTTYNTTQDKYCYLGVMTQAGAVTWIKIADIPYKCSIQNAIVTAMGEIYILNLASKIMYKYNIDNNNFETIDIINGDMGVSYVSSNVEEYPVNNLKIFNTVTLGYFNLDLQTNTLDSNDSMYLPYIFTTNTRTISYNDELYIFRSASGNSYFTLREWETKTEIPSENLKSHIGMIIFSETLDTLEKVQSIYGVETLWERIENAMLLGYSPSKHQIGERGGEQLHTLTAAEIVKHRHSWTIHPNPNTASTTGFGGRTSGTYSNYNCDYTGSSTSHENMPPYRTVAIWHRIG